MPNQQPKKLLSRRIFQLFIGLVTIVAILIGIKFLGRIWWRSITAPRVVASIRATFPDFCTDGEVRTYKYVDFLEILFSNYNYDNIWPIRCSTWKQSLVGSDIPLPATFVDLDRCTTTSFIFDITDEHRDEYEALKKSNGKKLAFCP